MPDLRTHIFEDGYTLQQNMLLRALKMQKHGILMTNPRVTGYTSFAKAVISWEIRHQRLVKNYINI